MSKNAEGHLSRLCIHTITTKPWKLDQAIYKYKKASIGGISVWENYLDGYSLNEAGRLLKDSGLDVVSLVRGGFFTGLDNLSREKAIRKNIGMIEEAAAIGAGLLVLVCGATPGQTLEVSRFQILKGIEAVLPHAEKNGVKLAIEPLHPVYSDIRSAINTIKTANDLAEKFDSLWLGVAVDVYHVWWDPELEKEIFRCGKRGKLFAFHICDWRVPTRDVLNDRELMGRGIINIQQIIDWVKKAGFLGKYEVEIFSNEYWASDLDKFLSDIIESFYKYKIE
ncbi:MAG TPA: sugar phosphate isomerase/epimerase family protein [Cyclobacteriaceae bacterium]|nr:sugar phosphate isomerase/epimerase family protein [Cyclobacteriaceae bacterium]